MGFPTKVQLIKRKNSAQWYINFPSAVAQAMEFQRGETVEWTVEDKSLLALKRHKTPPALLKKKQESPTESEVSSTKPTAPSARTGSRTGR